MKEYKIYKEVGFEQDTKKFMDFLDNVEKRINEDEEIIESVKKCNRKFYNALEVKIKNADPECAGTIVLNLLKKSPRYSYIKHLELDGVEYEAEIDALTRRFTIREV